MRIFGLVFLLLQNWSHCVGILISIFFVHLFVIFFVNDGFVIPITNVQLFNISSLHHTRKSVFRKGNLGVVFSFHCEQADILMEGKKGSTKGRGNTQGIHNRSTSNMLHVALFPIHSSCRIISTHSYFKRRIFGYSELLSGLFA